jgi:hypothetical protein
MLTALILGSKPSSIHMQNSMMMKPPSLPPLIKHHTIPYHPQAHNKKTTLETSQHTQDSAKENAVLQYNKNKKDNKS